MKKFMLDTKATLGLAPKTVDKDYDEKAAIVKEVDQALSEYKSAMERMKSAAQTVVTAMEGVCKAFEKLTEGSDVSESMKGISGDYEAAVKKIKDEDLFDFKRSIDGPAAVLDLKSLVDECKKLEDKRSKVMNEYDVYRETVSKKEEEYRKKGKELTDSKHYTDELAKRDALKSQFEEADKDFKTKFGEVEKKKLSTYLGFMSSYLGSTSQFFSAAEKKIVPLKEKAENINI